MAPKQTTPASQPPQQNSDDVVIVSVANPKDTAKKPDQNAGTTQTKPPQQALDVKPETSPKTIKEPPKQPDSQIPPTADTNIKTPTKIVPANENSWNTAKSNFENKDFAMAAKIWKNIIAKSPRNYTIQIELACQNDTLIEAYNFFPDKKQFYIIPNKFKNQACYVVGYGLYNNKIDADKAYQNLPSIFTQQKFPPRIVFASELIK